MADSGLDHARDWHARRGLIAFALCATSVEGVAAGASRSCMPSFNLTMVVQFVEMMNVFLVAPILTVVAGIPAFLVAASPAPSRRPSNLAMGCSAGVLLAIGLFARGLDVRAIVVAIACGVLVGAATRRVRVVRRYWPLFGIAGTVSIAVVTFALGHYNARYYTCWP